MNACNLALERFNTLLFRTWTQTSFLILSNLDHILLHQQLHHSNRPLAAIEAVLEHLILNDFGCGPCFLIDKSINIGHMISCLSLLSSVLVEAELLRDGLSLSFKWIAMIRHTVVHSSLELHAFNDTLLELSTSLLKFLGGCLNCLLSK